MVCDWLMETGKRITYHWSGHCVTGQPLDFPLKESILHRLLIIFPMWGIHSVWWPRLVVCFIMYSWSIDSLIDSFICSIILFPFCIFNLSILLPFLFVVLNFDIFVHQRDVPVINLLVHVETRCKLTGVPSQLSYMGLHLILPATMCGNTCKVLPTRDVHLSLGVQDLFWR